MFTKLTFGKVGLSAKQLQENTFFMCTSNFRYYSCDRYLHFVCPVSILCGICGMQRLLLVSLNHDKVDYTILT